MLFDIQISSCIYLEYISINLNTRRRAVARCTVPQRNAPHPVWTNL